MTFHVNLCIYFYLVVSTFIALSGASSDADKELSLGDTETELLDKEYGVRYASACEVCKYLAIELQDRFEKLGQTSQVIETGYQIDGPKKRVKYTKSELYLIESVEGVCDKLLEYNIHKERQDSTRFSKGMSSTFETLHKLVDKGVKVDIGVPLELWDSPSAEITALKQQCEDYVEKYYDFIEQWYMGDREQHLQQYLCRERVLKKDQKSCLDDPEPPKPSNYVPQHNLDETAKNNDTKSDDDSTEERKDEL